MLLLLLLWLLIIPVLTWVVAVALDVPARRSKSEGDGPTGVTAIDRLMIRLRPWRAATSILLAWLLFLAIVSHQPEFCLLLAVLLMALFVPTWRHELTLLMALPDDAFPGRNDKIAWIVLMVLLPPVGFRASRSYRAAHLPGVDAAWVADTAAPVVKPAPLPEGPWA